MMKSVSTLASLLGSVLAVQSCLFFENQHAISLIALTAFQVVHETVFFLFTGWRRSQQDRSNRRHRGSRDGGVQRGKEDKEGPKVNGVCALVVVFWSSTDRRRNAMTKPSFVRSFVRSFVHGDLRKWSSPYTFIYISKNYPKINGWTSDEANKTSSRHSYRARCAIFPRRSSSSFVFHLLLLLHSLLFPLPLPKAYHNNLANRDRIDTVDNTITPRAERSKSSYHTSKRRYPPNAYPESPIDTKH